MNIKPRPVRAACLAVFGTVVFLLAGGRAGAQSVAGFALNRSTWDNATLTPPGDGSGAGDLIVGVWGAEGDLLGPPLLSVVAASTVALPFPAGASYGYSLGPLAAGNYRVAAWIDGDGNGAYDMGEPRSPAAAFTIEADDVAANLTIVDDTDNDGIPDWWEVHWFGDIETANATSDYDRDGLTDLEEYQIAMSDPSLINLSPINWDTDGDGMDDGWEWQHYANGAGLHPCVPDADEDVDGDGLTNIQEYWGVDGIPRMRHDPVASAAATVPGARIGRLTGSEDALDPLDIDTDDDGLIDSFEFAWYDPGYGIDPRTPGDPGADPDRDGLTNFREQCLHTPLRQGGANDLWSGGPASLPPRDPVTGIRRFDPPLNFGTVGLPTLIEVVYALRDNATWTRPSDGSGFVFDHVAGAYWNPSIRPGWDTDGDLLPDGWEVEFGLDPRSGDLFIAPGVINPDGFLGDPDGDGLVNIQEYLGQDGERVDYITGSGDETNPNQHAWWPNVVAPRIPNTFPSILDFTLRQHSGGVVAGPLPTIPLGWDGGLDTDDNGIPDHLEIQGEYDGAGGIASSPVHSMDPFRMRSARIVAAAGIPLPDPTGALLGAYRPDLVTRAWTLECWVKLATAGRSGYLINLPGPVDDYGQEADFTARLGLSNDVPYIAFQTVAGKEYRVDGLALPAGQWSHVAGVWDSANNALSLLVDGIFVQSVRVYEESVSVFHYAMRDPPRLADSSAAGGSFANQLWIDEVRVWGVARTPEQVEAFRSDLVNPYSVAGELLAYYRFDDGGQRAEDFMRRARSSLLGGDDYLFADRGYALSAGFVFDPDTAATVYGVDVRGADDSSGDGLPDPWKMVNHLDIFSAAGDDGRDGDPDGDGLSNIYEYWSRTNPREIDTSGNGIPDAWEDLDGDGVPNIVEQYYGTRPDMVDTDNNGFTDAEEIAMGTNPIDPLDPLVSQSMQFPGDPAAYLEVPIQARQRLSSWTLEAWVHPVAGSQGTIIRRTVQRLPDDRYAANWILGVEPAGADAMVGYGAFITPAGDEHRIASQAFPAGQWTYLAAVYDASRSLLRIYTNGVLNAETNILMATPPVNGKGGEAFVRIGESFGGLIDEVRVWNTARSSAELLNHYDRYLDIGVDGLVHHFRFDDGQANENVVPFGEFHQPYGPQDFTHPEDWNSQWRHAAIMHGALSWVQPGAIVVPPSLRVLLDPQTAIEVGAQWALDGGAWRNSGDLIQNLDRRQLDRVLSFRPVPGWVHPDDQEITLVDGVMTVLTYAYIRYGSLTVGIVPEAARSAGAQWRVGDGAWRESGAIIELPPGNYTVSFSDVEGWVPPADAPVTIVSETLLELRPPTHGVYRGVPVSGTVINQSAWANDLALPPGDGSGNGTMRVGAWAAGSPLRGIPLAGVAVTNFGTALPFGAGLEHPFQLGQLASGTYRLVAWIDGNGNAAMDLGEPRSPMLEITLVADPHTTSRLTVNDDYNSNGDPIPDWWYVRYGFDPLGPSIADQDPDGDGISNYWEYRLASHPLDAYSLWRAAGEIGDIRTDAEWDSDRDGLPNWDEIQIYATDPTRWDTDDDGFGDGEELLGAAEVTRRMAYYVDELGEAAPVLRMHEYGYGEVKTDPLQSRNPLVRRSLILSGNQLEAPFSGRFAFIPEGDADDGPVVAITAPADGANVTVRFVEVSGSVQSAAPLESVRIYNNALFVQNVTLDNEGQFSVTIIIASGVNIIEVLAIDQDGGAGRASVRVNGDFQAADIRVTQTWSVPGDLDTWLVDPQGRHMGWTSVGPGYPSNVAERIPGAFLDIDDIPGTGPENVTVEQGSAVSGQYQVWMNNYSHQNNPQSTVRVLVREGQEGQQYVEFGPREMPVSDGNGQNPEAWWHVTTISWPSGTMDPPGTPVSGVPGDGGEEDDIEIALAGWTIEAWIRPLDGQQTGAIAEYRLPDGRLPYVVGLTNNRPFMRLRSISGIRFELSADALPADQWTHLAFVYGEDEQLLRLHTNGVLAASLSMPLPMLKVAGQFTVDAGFSATGGPPEPFSQARLDHLRVWSRARGAVAIAANRYRYAATTPSLVAHYHFDDGGLGIEDATRPRDRAYDLGGYPLPDLLTDAKPGPDGIWGTADDIAAGPGADGQNDYVTAADHAPVVVGSIRTVIEPLGAVTAGAEWRIDSGPWQASGVVVSNLDIGRYQIRFSDIPPWRTPEPIRVNLLGAELLTVTGRYGHVSGVQVFIEPSEAVTAGAGWRFSGGTDWYVCGQLVERNVGNHTIEFRSLAGWLTPGSFTTAVSNDVVNTYIRNYFLLEIIGVPGSDEPGQFRFPRGLALDEDRNLYVADSGNHRVQVRDPVSGDWTLLGTEGSAPGQFQHPFGVTIDPAGRVYIADANNNRIQRYDPATGAWTVWGGIGIGDQPGEFNGPFDVAIDAVGNAYVADHYNHRVQKRTAAGAWSVLITSGFGDHQTRLPSGLAVDGDQLIVADHRAETGVSRVRRFDFDGNLLETLPGSAEGIALNKPRSPFRASADSLLMADMANNRVLMYNTPGARWDVLIGGSVVNEPEGVAMDLPGFIYVADTANHRILRLGMSGYSGQVLSPYSTARPMRSAAGAGAGGFIIRWQGRAGWLYLVQFRDDLRNGAEWQPLPDAERIPGIEGLMETIDPEAPPRRSRFYRILAY